MSETLRERSDRFNRTTGALSWNYRSAALHPDHCVCNERPDNYPGTPHKHYPDPPFACARCPCEAYTPALNLDALTGWFGGALSSSPQR